MIRIVICDDQEVVCEGLRAILSAAGDIEVVGIASHGKQALELVEALHPDLVLMDLKLPVMNGVQATNFIRTRFPQTKVLVLTTYDADEWVFDAIRNGASSYLLKDTPAEQIIAAIRGTVTGKNFLDPEIAGKVMNQIKRGSNPVSAELIKMLNDREIEILRLIGSGMSNLEIAEKLFLSEGTVRNYVSSVFDKLQVADRTQAAILAIRSGLVDS